MAMMMDVAKVASGLNILLILGLLFVYLKNLSKIKTIFTFGLFIFGILFLTQNVVSFYFSITMMPLYVQGVELYVLIFTVLQTFAFAVLNYITWK